MIFSNDKRINVFAVINIVVAVQISGMFRLFNTIHIDIIFSIMIEIQFARFILPPFPKHSLI